MDPRSLPSLNRCRLIIDFKDPNAIDFLEKVAGQIKAKHDQLWYGGSQVRLDHIWHLWIKDGHQRLEIDLYGWDRLLKLLPRMHDLTNLTLSVEYVPEPLVKKMKTSFPTCRVYVFYTTHPSSDQTLRHIESTLRNIKEWPALFSFATSLAPFEEHGKLISLHKTLLTVPNLDRGDMDKEICHEGWIPHFESFVDSVRLEEGLPPLYSNVRSGSADDANF